MPFEKITTNRFWKYCPICLDPNVKIDRPIVKTCGSKSCMRAWRTMSNEQKFRLTTQAEERKFELEASIRSMEGDELEITPEMNKSIQEGFAEQEREYLRQQAQQATRPAEPHIPAKHFTPPGKTVQRDNEVLERLFGPDAPGIVREDTPDDKDKEK